MAKTLRIRFVRGKSYQGKDYGPGQPGGEVANVDEAWARRFIAQGAAVLEDGKAGKKGKAADEADK